MPTWQQANRSLGPAYDSDDLQENPSDASSESSEEAHEGGFFDTMAAEGSEDEESEDDSEIGFRASHPDPEFPQFLKLPIELRRHIWELYCPELRLKPRMMDFTINPGTARYRDPSWSPKKQVWTVTDGMMLADMTSATRRVLSVHAESRSMALAVLTDTLAIEAGSGDALVRFNPEKDLVKISGLSPRDYRLGDYLHLDGFADKVKNLSPGEEEVFRGMSWPRQLSDDLLRLETMEYAFLDLLDHFKNIETVFFGATHHKALSDDEKSRKRRLRWCASDLVNHHFIETHELVDGYGENLQYIFCWPDLINHKDFAKTSVDKLWCDEESMSKGFAEYFERRNIEYWPVVIFEAGKGRRRYESLFQEPDFDFATSDSDDWSDHSLATGPDLDAYESDGIDDAEVLETFDDSDDGNLSDADRRLSGFGSEDGSVVEGRFSSPEADSSDGESAVLDNRGELSDVGGEDVIEGRSSSPEGESASDAAPSPPVNRGRKRRIVSDSDEEEEETTEEPASKRPRMARVVLSDSEDEPVFTQQTSGSNRSRGRQVLYDSDDDDDDEDEGGVDVAPAVEKKAASSDDEDDSGSEGSDQDSDSSDNSDEDERPAPQLSLAERLRVHRETNPVSDDENESSGTVDVDDEDDDGESDDEDDESGLLLRMADDDSGSEDDEEDGYNY